MVGYLYMSYYKKRSTASKRKHAIGVVILISVMGIVAGLAYLRYELSASKIVLDDNLCPETGSPEYIAILFDKTDDYNEIQQRYLRNYFQEFKRTLKTGAHVALYMIRDSRIANLDPMVILCNPESGIKASALYQNPMLLQRRWEKDFSEPLDDAIERLVTLTGDENSSPIFEMIQAMALTAFPGNTSNNPRRIIIISDMLQHTDKWSHYRGGLDFSKLKINPYFQKISTDLHGAEIEILYVRRDGAERLQTRKHALFWQEYFAAMYGNLVLIERIDG